MLFTNPLFLFAFLPSVCAAFYFFARFGRLSAVGVLLVASVVFYAPWGMWPTALLFGSITVNFLLGLLLGGDHALPPGRLRTAAYGLGQSLNIGVLIWFKYQIIQIILHGSATPGIAFMAAAVPAGISFYTFHQAAFLADAFNKEGAVVRLLGSVTSIPRGFSAYVKYATFVSFFPQLVIGPITYFKEFFPQTEQKSFGRLKLVDLEVGLTLISIGLFKKLVLADSLSPLAGGTFAATEVGNPVGMAGAWVGALAYYLQLYFDFSGYSDMALGLARMFGLRYPINFFSPLKAVGIVDFYRRWHMTLTRVIARFVYSPLSLAGTRRSAQHRLPKPARRALSVWLPLMLNFEIIALWHGAHATFFLFGLFHGLWYVVETEVRSGKAFKAWRKTTSDRLRTFLGRLLFVVPMLLTFALFRSETVDGWGRLLSAMFGFGEQAPSTVSNLDLALVAFSLAIVYLAPNSIQLLRAYRPGLYTYDEARTDLGPRWLRWRPNLLWSGFIALLVLVAVYFMAREVPFLYQGF